LQPTRRELDLANHRYAPLTRRLNDRLVGWYAGTQDNKIRSGKCLRLMSAELELHVEAS
jgi:hypothetical protein